MLTLPTARKLWFFASLIGAGCQGPAAAPPRGPLQVTALSFPAGWLADRIGGDRVEVTVMPPAGEDPPLWQPDAAAVSDAARAGLLVGVGAGYEAWTATAALPEDRLFWLADSARLIELPRTRHSHGAQGAHEHVGADPHIWLDPDAMTAAAERLAARLSRADPEGAASFEAAAAALTAEVAAVDAAWREALAPLAGQEVAANHPTWTYWGRRYGFVPRVFDLSPTDPPSPATRDAVTAWRAAHPTSALWWESPPTPEVAAAFPGLPQLTLDPLEQPPGGGRYDWLAGARADAARLRTALAGPRPPEPTAAGATAAGATSADATAK